MRSSSLDFLFASALPKKDSVILADAKNVSKNATKKGKMLVQR
jgi:hypothetical protein